MPRRAISTKLIDNTKARKTQKELSLRAEIEENLQKIPATLKCPKELDGRAKRIWEEVVKFCTHTGHNFLNDLDTNLLRCYCESWERYEIAAKQWRLTCKKQINSKRSDLQKIIDRCLAEMSRAGAEAERYARALNIAPAERERIAILNAKADKARDSNMMGFFNNG